MGHAEDLDTVFGSVKSTVIRAPTFAREGVLLSGPRTNQTVTGEGDALYGRLRRVIGWSLSLFLGLVALATMVGYRYATEDALRARLDHASTVLHEHFRYLYALMADQPSEIMSEAVAADALLRRDREALLQLHQRRFNTLRRHTDVTSMFLLGVDGEVILRLHRPEIYGDSIGHAVFDTARLTGRTSTGAESDGLGAVSAFMVRPWYVDDELIGFVELGADISSLLSKRQFEPYLFELLESSIEGPSVISALPGSDPDTSSSLVTRVLSSHELEIRDGREGSEYAVDYYPLRDASEKPVAWIEMRVDATNALYQARLFAVIVIGVAISIALACTGSLRPLVQRLRAAAHESTSLFHRGLQEHMTRLAERNREYAIATKRHAAVERELQAVVADARQQEAWLHKAQRIGNIGHWRMVIEAGDLEWSLQVFRIFGLNPQQFVPTREAFLAAVHPEDRDAVEAAVREAFDQAIQNPNAYRVDHRIVRPDGEVRTVTERGEVLLDQHGKPEEMIGTVLDITEAVAAQQSLAEREEFIREQFNGIQIPVLTWRRDGAESFYLEDFNFAARDYFEDRDLRRESASTHKEIFTGQLEAMLECADRKTVLKRSPCELITAEGSEPRDAEVTFSFAPPDRVLMQIYDITDMKFALDEIGRLSSKYIELATIVPVGIFETNRDGAWTYVNKTWSELSGVTQERARNDGWLDAVHPLDRDLVEEHWAATVNHGDPFLLEFRFQRPEGESVWVLGRATMNSSSGQIVGAITDVTERKNAEAEAAMHAQELRDITNSVADGIITMDLDGIIETTNPAAASIFGYEGDELVGERMQTLIDDSSYLAEVQRCLVDDAESGAARQAEVTGTTKDGRPIPLELALSTATHADRTTFIASFRDLTQRKQVEEQLFQAQKIEAIGKLTGGVAHDFNNLLTVISANVEVIRDGASGEDVEVAVDDLLGAVQRGAELTKHLLAYSRKQNLAPEVVDIAAVVREAGRLWQRTLGEHVYIECDVDDAWPVRIDRAQLEAALLNLAINGRDAMPNGGEIRITAVNVELEEAEKGDRSRSDLPPGDYVELAVADTGFGMSPDIVERACEPFFTTKDVGRGTGLGLSTVYGFIRQSGGDLRILSTPGAGTRVEILLPRVMEAASVAREPDGVRAPQRPKGSETILVVEDDEAVRALTCSTLAELGYTVHSAADGAEATRLLSSLDGVDMLLTDAVLPHGMSGPQIIDFVQRLRAGIRTLLVSGYATDVLEKDGFFEQSTRIVEKPFSKDTLANAVRQTLDEPAAELGFDADDESSRCVAGFESMQRTLLLVDDEPRILKILSKALSRHGYQTHDAASLAEAIEVAESDQALDLVITDVQLSDGTGFNLARELETIRPELPVLYMSGNVADANRQAQHLMKPFSATTLIEKVEGILSSVAGPTATPDVSGD